ncbi:MAG: S9 family peptidase [Gammaproteobacteria bacterium]|nr:S9 family peptidase [Gammaproteobacteria bacterium]
MQNFRFFSLIWIALVLSGCTGVVETVQAPPGADQSVAYPQAARSDHKDMYFGDSVADPYRWMEDLESPEVAGFVAAQNEVAIPYLASIPARERIEKRIDELWSYESYRLPVSEGGRYFYRRNDGTQDQDVLYVTDDLSAEGRVLIDPNTFSDDATIALSAFSVSPDGSLVAYSTSDGGSDWKTWHVRNVATGEDLDDLIQGTKFTGVSWDRDSQGFYYSRYPWLDGGAEGEADDSMQVKIYHHVVGKPQSADKMVYAITDHDTRSPYAQLTEDGRYLLISAFDGYQTNGLYYRDLSDPSGEVVRLFDDWDALYYYLGNDGSQFYLYTTRDAPNARVVSIDVADPNGGLREVVAEQDEALEAASYIGGYLVTSYIKDAYSKVSVYQRDGEKVRDVDMPGIGSAYGFSDKASSTETFFGFQSYTVPPSFYHYDVASGERELFRAAKVDADLDAFEVTQVFYRSADGTKVPMFIIHRSDIELSGDNPTLLYGYGGFNVSQTPRFSVSRTVWMEMGGVMAIANLRGGGEYGEAWHEAGTRLQKQNVFDDFIAAAEYLVDTGYTSPNKLAIQGGSNGGLLVAAVTLQRPELFAATLPAVGVLDMLRYHTASANARQWSSDYGLSEVEEEYRALRAYSPVHNVAQGVCYPPTLITTADRDDRVVPWHSFKWAAEMQRSQGCNNPILLRVETRAGHGAGKPRWMIIEDLADKWAFLAKHLAME